MHLLPSDRAILYNIAMIQQKAAEMLFALEPSRRTLDELNVALKQAQQAAKLVCSYCSSQDVDAPQHIQGTGR